MQIDIEELENVDLEKLLSQKSLHHFVKNAWHLVDSAKFVDGWQVRAICDHLQAVAEGKIRRLIINIPPRCSKSLLTSVLFPAWTWINAPGKQFLTGSYAASLAVRDATRARDLISNPWYKQKFGQSFKLAGDQNQKTYYKNDHHGHRMAFSVKGKLTGEGGDIIIIDDPLNYKEATSANILEGVNTWFDEALTNRQNNIQESAIIIIMQRLHENDLTGHLLERGGWIHLELPVVLKSLKDIETEKCRTPFFTDPRTTKTELLNNRYTHEGLAQLEVEMGSYGFAAQMLQRPAPREGTIIKVPFWKFYTKLPEFNFYVLSYDTAFKEKEQNDYSAMTTWGIVNRNYYLLRWWMERLDITKLIPRIIKDAAEFPNCRILMEDKASGQDIYPILKKNTKLVITMIKPKGDKIERAKASTIPQEAGKFFLPDPSIDSSTEDFIRELATFPNATHDDLVDSYTQFANWAQKQYKDSAPRVILV